MTDQTPAVEPSVRAAAVTKLRRRLASATPDSAITVSVNMLNHVLAEHDDAKRHCNEAINSERAEREHYEAEIARLRPWAEAGEAAARQAAAADYANSQCDYCSCCIASGCHTGSDSTCPTNGTGDSVCPCTED